jgi:formylglycine-generating enzyme required for sulfatase activity
MYSGLPIAMRRAATLLLALCSGCGTRSTDPPFRLLGLNARGYAEYLRARDGMPMVRVPAGPYPRRPYEPRATTAEPETVDVASYLIDKLEVSNRQFARFLAETGADLKASRPLLREQPWGLRRSGTLWEPQPGYEEHPAVGVTGWGALSYARWAGGQLPSPDAWMKAAGGPEGLEYPFGPWKEDACNWQELALRTTAPVTAFPESASPVGCLNMAGNVYERVFTQRDGERLPVMIKGGAWVTAHPLNLRVLDLCMQGMDAAEQSVGFRCMIWESALADALPPEVPRPGPILPAPPPLKRAPPPPSLVLAGDFFAGLEEARERNCVILLSLHLDTCGQCDRTREECLTDPALVKHLNEACVTVLGQEPGDAGPHPHPPLPDGGCPLFPGLSCTAHETIFREALTAVRHFVVSPGNFILTPHAQPRAEPEDWILVGELELSKNGDGAEGALEKLRQAQERLGPFLKRDEYLAIKAAMEAGDPAGLRRLLEGKDPRIPLIEEAQALLHSE